MGASERRQHIQQREERQQAGSEVVGSCGEEPDKNNVLAHIGLEMCNDRDEWMSFCCGISLQTEQYIEDRYNKEAFCFAIFT